VLVSAIEYIEQVLRRAMPILFKSDDSDAVIQDGDLAIVVLSHRSMNTITVCKDQVLSNKNGFFPHNSFIGKPWGLKVYSEGSDGFVRIIRPTAELWTLTLPHRTQVIYQPDISLTILLLELCPGKTVAGVLRVGAPRVRFE
jgi:tRNA (adenine57-N1/adenine58-N1)-methyltransferase